MTVVPAGLLATMPVAEPTGIAILLLLHAPPGTLLVKVALRPEQRLVGPLMAAGTALTVMG
jgi:hypothetical protein